MFERMLRTFLVVTGSVLSLSAQIPQDNAARGGTGLPLSIPARRNLARQWLLER